MSDIEEIKSKLAYVISVQEKHNKDQDKMSRTIEKIYSGMYGDVDNKFSGMVSVQREHAVQLKNLEEAHGRIKWTLGGIFLAMQTFSIWLYEMIRK